MRPLNQVVATWEHQEVGDTAAVLDQYRAVVERWGDADPELEPRVRRARDRTAARGG